MMAAFRAQLEERGLTIDDGAFDADIVFIRAMMRYEIDLALFSVEEARRNLVDADPQAQLALSLFPEAERLLRRSRRGGAAVAAWRRASRRSRRHGEPHATIGGGELAPRPRRLAGGRQPPREPAPSCLPAGRPPATLPVGRPVLTVRAARDGVRRASVFSQRSQPLEKG